MKLSWLDHSATAKMESKQKLRGFQRQFPLCNKSQSSMKSEVIEVNFRYTALIAMCLGFLCIWSTVVSMIFVKNNFDESVLMQKPLEIFLDQERIGRVMFSVGQEMLFTVDSLVSVQLNLTTPDKLDESVNFTWSLTNNEIRMVKEELNRPSSDLIYLLTAIEVKLNIIRANLSLKNDHPLSLIMSYQLIFDLSEQYSIERSLYSNRKIHDSHWHLMHSFIEIQHAPYALFIKGMNRRFIELAYGTIYHIGPQLIEDKDESQISNYFYYFYSSHELIENAFLWNPLLHRRYMEVSRNPQMIYATSRMNLYRLSGRDYTRFVTDVVAYLLRAKDVLNVSFRELLTRFTTNNTLIFYVIIAFIHLLGLLVCTIFFILFIRNARIKENTLQKSTVPNISQLVGSYYKMPAHI